MPKKITGVTITIVFFVLSMILLSVYGYVTIAELSTILALCGVAWQVDEQHRLMKSSVHLNIASLIGTINQVAADHPEEYKSLDCTEKNVESVDCTRLKAMSNLILNTFEQLYIHHKDYEMFDKREWKLWEHLIREQIKKPYLVKSWNAKKNLYDEGFKQFLDSVIREVNNGKDETSNGDQHTPHCEKQ